MYQCIKGTIIISLLLTCKYRPFCIIEYAPDSYKLRERLQNGSDHWNTELLVHYSSHDLKSKLLVHYSDGIRNHSMIEQL